MVIPPLIGNPYNGHINPYCWVDDHPLLYGNNGSLDPSTCSSEEFELGYLRELPPCNILVTDTWVAEGWLGGRSVIMGIMCPPPKEIMALNLITPQKSNIDTKNCHFERELPFPNHHFGYPAVSFRGSRPLARDMENGRVYCLADLLHGSCS